MATTVFKAPDSDDSRQLVTGSTINELLTRQQESSIQLKLTSLLQTTLKIEPLFDLFFGQLQHLLKIHSCEYTHADKKIHIELGTLNTHTTEYTLNLEQLFLGSIIFSRKQRFTEAELMQIESLLGILVYPLRNAISYRDAIRQASRDPLTGLGNRGALDDTLNHQWQMAQRYGQHFSVLMIDIDFFKNVNDTYGHAVGDRAIKDIARTIATTTRQTDLSYRYGGEEFLVILSKSQTIGAKIIAERIRENIESLHVDNGQGGYIRITASVGGSHSCENDNTETLLQQADSSLYHAKHSGRNQVAFFKDIKDTRTERKLLVTSHDS